MYERYHTQNCSGSGSPTQRDDSKMAMPTSRKDEDLVVEAAIAVLNKYGADSNLSDLLRRGGRNDATTVFNIICGQLVGNLQPLTTIGWTKALFSFHQLSVTVLEDLWKQLFTELGVVSVVALTRQSVNRHLFNILLVEAKSTSRSLSLSSSVQCDATPVVMGSEEENAVRYADGYVAMKLMKQFMKKDTKSAAECVECLSHMALEGYESDFYTYTREWVRIVDRGGLFRINTSSFLFFRALEIATHALLPCRLRNPCNNTDGLQHKIAEDEDVRFTGQCYQSTFVRKRQPLSYSNLLSSYGFEYGVSRLLLHGWNNIKVHHREQQRHRKDLTRNWACQDLKKYKIKIIIIIIIIIINIIIISLLNGK